MNKFKSKKGFTLAELLIVVAIIAVLVAIAVPLFVSGLKRAEDAVIDANERSLLSMAVTAILTDEDNDYKQDEDGTLYKEWKVKGQYVSETKTLKIDSITGSTETGTKLNESTEKSKKTVDGYELWIIVTASDLTVGS